MTRRDLRWVSRTALVSLCALAAGCGGDDGPSDQQQIATAVGLTLTSRDVKESCGTAVTKRFVREVFGSRAACRESNKRDASDKSVQRASTSQTRIEAGRATTAAKATIDGVTVADGRLALVREGDDWKVDRFGVDFLRSYFAGIGRLPDAPTGTAACVKREIRGLSSKQVRRLGNAVIGERFEDAPRITACLLGKPGTTIGREILERAMKRGLEKVGEPSKALEACVSRRLRGTVSDKEIAHIASDADDLPLAVMRKIESAVFQC